MIELEKSEVRHCGWRLRGQAKPSEARGGQTSIGEEWKMSPSWYFRVQYEPFGFVVVG